MKGLRVTIPRDVWVGVAGSLLLFLLAVSAACSAQAIEARNLDACQAYVSGADRNLKNAYKLLRDQQIVPVRDVATMYVPSTMLRLFPLLEREYQARVEDIRARHYYIENQPTRVDKQIELLDKNIRSRRLFVTSMGIVRECMEAWLEEGQLRRVELEALWQSEVEALEWNLGYLGSLRRRLARSDADVRSLIENAWREDRLLQEARDAFSVYLRDLKAVENLRQVDSLEVDLEREVGRLRRQYGRDLKQIERERRDYIKNYKRSFVGMIEKLDVLFQRAVSLNVSLNQKELDLIDRLRSPTRG